MGLSVLISAWLVGALSGLHCMAMCGGLLAAAAARDGGAQPMLPARTVVVRQLAYQAGRISTYSLLGAAFGTAGALALHAADYLPLQRALYFAANVFLLLLGASLAFATPASGWLQRTGARAFGAILTIAQPALRRPDAAGRIALGLLWGLLPCGLVYSMLPLALFAGGPWQGGAVMLAFGLGTLPNLMAANFLFGRARRALDGRTARYAVAAVLIAFGLIGIWRVAYDPGALARGAFCLVP
jgi:sulfite exporter TauE/SafE